ncbi:MAG: hypothetical protein MUC43_07220 [Pirellula sp.]|jgi:hypothetical protein|nr:hypothetical protein [Pirellula sp.]
MASSTTTHSATFSEVASQDAKPIAPGADPRRFASPSPSNDVESRSDLLARLISRQFPLDESVSNVFKNPISSEIPHDAFPALVSLLSEIINPSFLDQITGANKRFELHAKFLRGLAFCLHHVRSRNNHTRPMVIDTLLLYSLMPIYLASSRDKIVTAVEGTMNKLRQSACVVGWLNVMDFDTGYLWLEEQASNGQFLDSAIEHNLKISVPRIASQYWSYAACTSQSVDMDKGFWELACRIIRGDSQIHIPKSMIPGVVSWEKILQHWNSLKKELVACAHNSSANSVQVAVKIEDSCQESRLLDAIKSVSSNVEAVQSEHREKESQKPIETEPISNDRRLVEIRSSSDSHLQNVLEQLLQRSREEQTTLTIAVVSRLNAGKDKVGNWFSPMIDQLIEESEAEDLKGFITDSGELALMFYDVDRSDVAYWLRESFLKLRSGSSSRSMHVEASEQLIAGVAMVNAPSRSFQLNQLTDAAWRCRDGAAIQGANAVKTIEVY